MNGKLLAAVRRRPVTSFFVLAYLLSWSWWVPIALAGGVVHGGDPWPTHMPGLLGPLLAAVTITAAVGGRAAVAEYVGRLWRWHGGWRTAVLAASPLAMLAVGLAGAALAGQPVPPWQDLFVISGLPSAALPMLVGLIVLNGFGEEGGWRGFAQERLQTRYGPVRAALLTAVGWAVWHAPLFVILASFRGFDPAVLPGFFLGMLAGAVVLAYVYNAAGGGIAAAACWHVAYNLSSASAAASGIIAAVATTVVILWAVVLLIAAYRDHRRNAPSPLLGGRGRPADSGSPTAEPAPQGG
ncbi:type II CAAX endopeptidase family protein [Micromonospora sp. CPCC 205711]|uniref:CPBP family intramembrane glutamic endopeptidase n=1 Tax=Micromonospora sp. CPCC 205547 TaxID=3122400 RepID=UPI002FEF730B